MENNDMDIQWQGDASVKPTLNVNHDKDDLEEQSKRRYEQDTKFRKHLAVWVMIIVPTWMALVLVIVFFNGFSLTDLSDTAMVALLSTTTVNVLGLAYIVLKGIFPESKDK